MAVTTLDKYDAPIYRGDIAVYYKTSMAIQIQYGKKLVRSVLYTWLSHNLEENKDRIL